jgi:hypothetical protein
VSKPSPTGKEGLERLARRLVSAKGWSKRKSRKRADLAISSRDKRFPGVAVQAGFYAEGSRQRLGKCLACIW